MWIATFEAKQKELEGKVMPIMQRTYQNTADGDGGAHRGDVPGGIDANMFNQGGFGVSTEAGSGHSGPRVGEVDYVVTL